MDALLELERRGELPERQTAALTELRSRGELANLPDLASSATPEPQSMGMGEMMGGAIRNFPGSAVQFAKDITAPIHSPVQTAKGLGNLGNAGVAQRWSSPVIGGQVKNTTKRHRRTL